jgi:STE24 endopeptidase
VLLPMFYRFKPLDRAPLLARIDALSRRAGVPVLGVYEWSLGDKSRRANAALVGAGANRRILLSDTLLADYSDDEIEVILAHELGHHAHRDIRNGLAIEAAIIALACASAAAALALTWRVLGLEGPADVAGLPLLVMAGGLVSLLATPFLNAWSRRNEHRADRFALELTDRPDAFVSAMRRLAAQNLAEERPSAATLWLFHSHPPFDERIQAARAARAFLS